jgi:hypothetical protein
MKFIIQPRLIRVDPMYCYLNVFLKKQFLENIFKINIYFYYSSKLFLIHGSHQSNFYKI